MSGMGMEGQAEGAHHAHGAACVVVRTPEPLDDNHTSDDEDERVAKVGKHLPELGEELLDLAG